MSKPRKPWLCDATSSCKPPQAFCATCINATFRGQATIDGKRYRWFWRPYCYVEFDLKYSGDRHISRKHPVWKAVDKWVEHLIGQSETKEVEQWVTY
jgi:hypothetical protein